MDFICALVPYFLAALARRDNPELHRQPLLIGRSSEIRGNVVAYSEEAARAGVVAGMPISRAMALCPAAGVVALREEHAEVAARSYREVLADLCPATEEVEPGHIHADVRGMATLARLEPSAYLSELRESIAGRLDLPVQVGGAQTVFVAHAAAGYLADPVKLLAGENVAFLLADLPVEALPVSQEMLRRLHLFGLERLEQVEALSPTALQAQFGREGLVAWRLIHGEEAGRIDPSREDIRVVERLTLPAPAVASSPLSLATEILLQRAMNQQEIAGRALRHVDWAIELENEERISKRFVFQEPTADQTRMLFAIRHTIERLALGAPAVAVELTLSHICSEYVRQERLWQTGPRGRAALAHAVEQLAVRGGGPQVYRVVEVEPWSRIPERQRALAAYSP